MRRLPIAALLLLAACRSAADRPSETGAVLPTVAGRAAPVWTDGLAARRAFTRIHGSLTATLEDAAWLRHEGDALSVAAAHRAYFDYGYTTFQVELRSRAFAQPTTETFLLEDSDGRRLEGHPIGFEGSPVLVDGLYYCTFSLSFPHLVTADLDWIRLTRRLDGSVVTWTFCPPAPGA